LGRGCKERVEGVGALEEGEEGRSSGTALLRKAGADGAPRRFKAGLDPRVRPLLISRVFCKSHRVLQVAGMPSEACCKHTRVTSGHIGSLR
jgi:hypothetical protein